MNLDSRKQRPDCLAVMENRLFGGSVFKDDLNKEIFCKHQNLLHHESSDGYVFFGPYSSQGTPLSENCRAKVGSGISQVFFDQNLFSGLNRSIASNSGCDMLRLNDGYTSLHFPQSSNDYHRDSSKLAYSDGKNMHSLEDLKHLHGKVVSPEQFSSITACSEEEWYSDKELNEAGMAFSVGTFSELTSGDIVEQYKHNTWLPAQTKENTHALSSMTFSKPELSNEQLSRYWLQACQPKQCHVQSCPPAHSDLSFEAQSYWHGVENRKLYNEVPRERLPKLSQLPLEQPQSFQQQGFHNTQDSIATGSLMSMNNILALYLNYKNNLVNDSRSQQEFLDYLHSTVCKVQNCECDKYGMLILHFDKCHKTACNVCGPVHQLHHTKIISPGPVFEPRPIMKITSGPGKPKEYVSRDLHPRDYVIQDMQPTSKRMKIENVDQHDDWSLGMVVFPHLKQRVGGLVNDEDNAKKINKEVLYFKEAPTSASTWNDTEDKDVSNSPKVCFTTMDEFSGLRHSPEGCIYLPTLNKEVPRSMGKIAEGLQTFYNPSDNKNLGHDDAICHREVHNLVDEQPEMGCVNTSFVKSDVTFSYQSPSSDCISVLPEHSPIDEGESTKLMAPKHDSRDAKYDLANSDYHCGRKMEDLKVSDVSLTDFFTAEQIKVHLCSLNPCFNLKTGKELGGDMPAHSVGLNTCQLCAKDGLTFSAPPMYCTCCGVRIKHKFTYYWTQDGIGERCCFCTVCFKNSRGGNISFRGLSFSKATLHKDKNTEESGEPWVQCDRCEQWQHQICALYNYERDFKGEVKYICPFCRLVEIETKVHLSIPPASGARDLPRTKLSDHIEQRLFKSLEQERKQRAVALGKHLEEVPGASDLIVRVVLAVNKQLKVEQQFLDILHNETYPTEFPYKSKVILLFQRIEGADVCLFAMYVQEFGSECGNPNKRSVYISYLDSVKYFRPEIKTITGVALRTFVYHEILIGYLDYCKQRGFATCYIWACPSLRGDDYILNCHPGNQRRPNSIKLVHWYKKMLRKAKEENVVVGFTNFYDHFFVPSGESSCKITAARLPYFDGDYWSGAIVDAIQSMEKDSGVARQFKHQMTKRAIKAMGHSNLSVDARKDILVMQKLGHSILPVKEEFFVVHLQFTCTNCHEPILSGGRWSCNQCSKFHLCGRCLEFEQFPVEIGLESHMNINGEKHPLHQFPVSDAAGDTDDKDALLDNNAFDDRHSFLKFCQKNHYQFDTLRRAKHSSMMILHHLQTSKATSLETICCICNQDFKVGWHCEICSEFHVCDVCYQKEGDSCHIHKLVQLLMKADSGKKSEQTQQLKALQAKTLLDLLNHAHLCQSTRDNPCSYPKCLHLKHLFRHMRECKLRQRGGCPNCGKIWCLLRLHARNCRNTHCSIPRCMDIRNHLMLASKPILEHRAAGNNLNDQ